MNGIDGAVVAEIPAASTHELRRLVLRAGTPSTAVVWSGDDDSDTVHLGVFTSRPEASAGGLDTRPTAISTWLNRPSPDLRPSDATPPIGIQLRGMATDPTVRGNGHGALLLAAGIDRARHFGADHVWANARSSVLGFYLARGFEIVSGEFVSDDTAIAHRRILLRFDRTP